MFLRAAVVLCLLITLSPSCASSRRDVIIWRVGSPHRRSEVPAKDASSLVRNLAAKQDVELAVDAFPADGFQTRFRESQARESLPDLLVFDNMGVLTGFPPQYGGGYEGIAENPSMRRDFIRVTGTFESLLGPQRGWTYLHKQSPNHTRAKRLALTQPTCPDWTHWPAEHSEVIPIVRSTAMAYLRGERERLRILADPERLETTPAKTWQRARVDLVQPCGIIANETLAFAWLQVVYQTSSALGHKPLLVVLRKFAEGIDAFGPATGRLPGTSGRREVRSVQVGTLIPQRTLHSKSWNLLTMMTRAWLCADQMNHLKCLPLDYGLAEVSGNGESGP